MMQENTPVKFLKREGLSLEGRESNKRAGSGKKFSKDDLYSYQKLNYPHTSPATRDDEFYEDHGSGDRFGEKRNKREDRIQKGKTFNKVKNNAENYVKEYLED